jgi:hypothetical protein
MNSYFYINNITKQQNGPFTPEQLKNHNINSDTMVWCAGMTDWVRAGSVQELEFLFNPNVQSPINQQQPVNPPQQPYNNARPQYKFQNINPQQANAAQDNAKNLHYMRPIPKNWLIESILVTIFCCLPFGIAGIVYATKVETYYYAGDYTAAENASKEAKKWTIVALIAGPTLWILYFIFVFGLTFWSAF